MNFVHMADIHFDRPFVNLSSKENGGELRRLEQRKAFRKVIEYIKQNKIEYFFISGDLYEQNSVKKSTIDFINQQLAEIPDTRVFIAPGNHDPYLKNSYYQQYSWNSNVTIFGPKFEKIELEECDIYGFGFGDYYCQDCGIETLTIENPKKTNILVIHATLDGANIEDKQYNSISKRILKEKGFDYIALGHIHIPNDKEEKEIVYPGSTVALGFDELGQHGVIVGEINNKELMTEFLVIDEEEFLEKEIDISSIFSKEELIELLNQQDFKENQFVKIVLVGSRQFEIDSYLIEKLIENEHMIRIKDKTKIAYPLQEIALQTNLKGLYVKQMLQQLEGKNEEEKKIIEKAIEIGLEALQF